MNKTLEALKESHELLNDFVNNFGDAKERQRKAQAQCFINREIIYKVMNK
jgi:hypothetical protein